jgi:hypothetical protein
MKTMTFALTLAAAAALTAPVARNAEAAYTGVQKCRAADGTTVYTDAACGQFGATPAPMSSELGLRLASERADALQGDVVPGSLLPDAAGTPTGRRSLAAGCARSPAQLAMDVQASIGLHDVNRLVESFHWVGVSHQEALPVLQRLDSISRSRVLASQVHGSLGSQFADAGHRATLAAPARLQLVLQGDEAPRSLDLNVEQYSGCYFARF